MGVDTGVKVGTDLHVNTILALCRKNLHRRSGLDFIGARSAVCLGECNCDDEADDGEMQGGKSLERARSAASPILRAEKYVRANVVDLIMRGLRE